MLLENKVAIVTGGARDIGKAVSLKLASEGAKVVINYFDNEAQATQTLIEIKAAGGDAIIVQGDMTKKEDVDNVVAQATEAYGDQVDILVNVAGGLVARKKIDEMDLDFFNFVIQLNLNTAFLMTQAVVPLMPKGSSIVNFASQAGKDGGGPGASAYATAKGALMTFTRSMAKELGPKGIRVNSLCPGMIATTFHDTFTATAVREKVAVSTPLGREGRAEEVADFVACLASNQSSFVTGTNIDINGGLMFS
ncbi:SDR family NAD(P)-dependent oxidoreductase [Flammeovirga sp. SJP92]|uniref:SDR family NAD(P)-dependent oxidoreductase n=1 Tax=Flammeovirga sp. SJP92 TaxID=1775430 RepID=UPI0007885105|nr:glucose 1-dehydrogenase [Flammeovirga sp. SJP92]KXX72138.1 oxidoreductase [Flammeovirga sp. SJP92]